MGAWSDVLRWDSAALEGVGDALSSERKVLDGVLGDIEDGSVPRQWRGEAAEAARSSLRDRIEELEALKTDVAAMIAEVDGASEAVAATLRAVEEAESLAAYHGFRITEAGNVVDERVQLETTPQDVIETRAAVQQELVDRIEQILRRAAEIDESLVGMMTRLTSGATLPGAYIDEMNAEVWGGAPPPPTNGSPTEIAGWWATLSDDEREWLVNNRPERIGTMDGLPVAERSEANMLRLPAERERLEAELEELRADGRESEIHQVQAQLDSIESIEDMMDGGDRSLITLDLDGERARAAIGTGDVDNAEKVSVFTPGMNSTVSGNMEDYVREMEQVQREAQEMLRDDELTSDQEVASVVYLDYEPPKTVFPEVREGLHPDRYEEGARRLAPFLDGLAANRTGDIPMHLTATGHSYGSPTTGLALRESSAADAVVFHGAPGVGSAAPDDEGRLAPDTGEEVWTDSDEMRVPEGSMYNLSNEEDIIANTGWHGVNPSLDKHITELSTDDAVAADGRELHATYGHTSYVEEREPTSEELSTSEYNTAAVIADKTDVLIEQPR
ncbi:hypothetical protein H0B56_00805 [Haloechinothrix sp. YIM 98757]|uniref:DUF1023 domain-containing protein n=1 Tax=Haloechinothrix aidingensis TaxID=2752311 RepID=A0A838A546_9PSEU|nr:alpha/beta hydrolase [Haloechinothrix aidingensis]MBA0124078.1 hypothetical protein [Haloechinothrix aidingensis]